MVRELVDKAILPFALPSPLSVPVSGCPCSTFDEAPSWRNARNPMRPPNGILRDGPFEKKPQELDQSTHQWYKGLGHLSLS